MKTEKQQYQSPSVEVMEIHARSRILSVSTDASVQSNDWAQGSESIGGFGDDEDEQESKD